VGGFGQTSRRFVSFHRLTLFVHCKHYAIRGVRIKRQIAYMYIYIALQKPRKDGLIRVLARARLRSGQSTY